ncbi:hypothetical protein LBMAG42_30450 [Deltaproteobacteria bacterium]|nr:hypothetical protein LBMAG42_30450 [Deltaproteobacteria bacterium]
MSILRTSRLELRLTPAQKALIGRGAAARGKTLSEYVVEALVGAALRDTAAGSQPGALGWMRGTATLADEPVVRSE